MITLGIIIYSIIAIGVFANVFFDSYDSEKPSLYQALKNKLNHKKYIPLLILYIFLSVCWPIILVIGIFYSIFDPV